MFRVRPFIAEDLPRLFNICLLTGDSGSDGTSVFSDRDLVGHYYAAPYPAYDPAHCLVLADEQGPVGYILGAVDTESFVHWFNREYLPPLREIYRDRSPLEGAVDGWLFETMRRDAVVPIWVKDYPAHLHIDLLSRAQGKGLGRQLFEAWTLLAAEAGASGVHLGVSKRNLNAIQFYEHMGMKRQEDAGGAWMYVMKLR